MKKSSKAGYIIFCGLFLLVSVIPSAGMFIGKKSGRGKKSESPEKVHISLTDESGKINVNLSKEVDSYVSRNFAFRNKLISADTFLKENLFHVSANDEVIIGKDGWLFYSETADDFINIPNVSQDGIKNIIHNLEMMDEYVTRNGGKFLVTVAPNKNTIYPEYMPLNYIKSDFENNLDRLSAALDDSSVGYCDLRSVLRDKKSETDELLYHKKDTHWNNTGALYAADQILGNLGVCYIDYSGTPYITEKTWKGDLDRMLWPGYDLTDYQNNYQTEFTYNYKGRYKSSDDLVINTENEAGTGSMLMFRDSFGAAIIPFLSQNLSQVTYLRTLPYPLNMTDSGNYDYVVLEIVERNIDWLEKKAPVLYAEEIKQVPQASDTCSASVFTSDENNPFFHIYGEIDIPTDRNEAPVYYVTLTDEKNQSRTFKAYNCCEADLLGKDTVGDNGYSLYIPVDDLDGEYSVTVTASFSGHTYSAQAGRFVYQR